MWIDADDGATITVINPATGEELGAVPKFGRAETARTVAAAQDALGDWRKRTAKERAVILRKWYDLVMADQEELARLMTAEQGKPLAEARGEIAYTAGFIEWFSEEGRRIYGDVIPPHQSDKRIIVFKQPIGVVAAITPWNFPAAMITRKVGPALAAGCTVVLKPASQTRAVLRLGIGGLGRGGWRSSRCTQWGDWLRSGDWRGTYGKSRRAQADVYGIYGDRESSHGAMRGDFEESIHGIGGQRAVHRV